jgi:hypothetical protein
MPKTLTPVDAVETAERQLADAVLAEQETAGALTALKDKIRETGPGAVSAEELLAATARADHARHGVGYAQRVMQDAHTAARLARLHDLKIEILETAGSAGDALSAINKIAEGVAELVALCAARQANFTRWAGIMRREGIGNNPAASEENGHLGWVNSDWSGDSLKVDGRTIRTTPPGILIEAALVKGTEAAGQRPGYLKPLHPSRNRDLVDGIEQWLGKSW